MEGSWIKIRRGVLSAALVAITIIHGGCASFVANNTTAPVGTDSGDRGIGQTLLDGSIERTAKINLYKLDQRFKQSRVNIDSYYGHVLLTGQVPDIALKQLAEENLASMSDVKTVHNYLVVGPQISYSTIMQDLAATADAKSKLLRAAVIRDSKVKIRTENGVLYVMGRLNNAEITDLNQVLQRVSNVVKIVSLIDNIETPIAQPIAAPALTAQPSTVAGIGLGTIALPPPITDPTPVAEMPTMSKP